MSERILWSWLCKTILNNRKRGNSKGVKGQTEIGGDPEIDSIKSIPDNFKNVPIKRQLL